MCLYILVVNDATRKIKYEFASNRLKIQVALKKKQQQQQQHLIKQNMEN